MFKVHGRTGWFFEGLLIFGLVLGLFGGPITPEGFAAGEAPTKILIQIGYPLGKGTISDESAMLYKKLVEGKLAGRVEIQIFPDGTLGKDTAVLEGLRMGTHDATIIATPITTVDPQFGFFDLPYLFTSKADVEKITNGPIGKKLLAGLSAKGIKGVAYWNSGWRHVTTSTRAIRVPEDFKGLKIRVPASPSRIQLFKMFGANPSPISFGELFSAMQQKVVDGQENPLYIVTSSKFYEVQKYLSFTKHVYTSNYLLFSQAKWNKYPADVQKVLQDMANEVADQSWTMDEDLDKKALQVIGKSMQINEVDLGKFKAAVMPIYKDEKFIKPIGQGLMNDVLKTLGAKI